MFFANFQKFSNAFLSYSNNSNNIGVNDLSKKSTVAANTISRVLLGKNTIKAISLCTALGSDMNKFFIRVDKKDTLCSRTVLHHHKLVCSVLECAVNWQLIADNCTKRVKPPKVGHSEMTCYDEDTIIKLLELLEKEPIKHKALLYTSLFAGCRLGELSAL